MTESDKVKMTISVGGEHIALSVGFNKQDAVRKAERSASELFNSWRLRWPARSDKEILAMVAYQFASYYQDLLSRIDEATAVAEEINRKLDWMVSNPED